MGVIAGEMIPGAVQVLIGIGGVINSAFTGIIKTMLF
jgi:hypothetical protein